MIEPRYNMPGELSDAYIKSLYDDMAYRMPSAKGLLDHRKWAFADGALQIPMDEVSESISQTHCGIWRRAFSGELGRSCPVHAVRADAQGFCTRTRAGGEPRGNSAQGCGASSGSRSETPKPKKSRPAPQQHTGYQRPRAEKVRRTTSSSAS